MSLEIETGVVPIKWRLAAVMADREVDNRRLNELTGLHPSTISTLRASHVMPPRLDRVTLLKLCRALDCQPGELLRYVKEEK